jgi:hypothetical protein
MYNMTKRFLDTCYNIGKMLSAVIFHKNLTQALVWFKLGGLYFKHRQNKSPKKRAQYIIIFSFPYNYFFPLIKRTAVPSHRYCGLFCYVTANCEL